MAPSTLLDSKRTLADEVSVPPEGLHQSDDDMSDTCDKADHGRLRKLVKAAYGHIPAPLRRLLDPLVYCYRMYDEIRPRFWIAEGQGRDDGTTIAMLCVAGTWDRSFLLGRALGGQYRERCIGRAWLWNLSKVEAGKGQHCCAVAVRVRPGFRRFLGSQRWLRIPAWVVGEVDIPLPRRILSVKSVRDDFRRIRKSQWEFEVTKDPEDFDQFYDQMYVPYARAVFDDGARIWPRDLMAKNFAAGELVLVSRKGERAAGLVISYPETEPRLVLFGVTGGDRQLVRDGVLSALYHFSFRYLAERGFAKAWLGKSRAFLRDGPLLYKKKLGMRLIGAAEGYFYLRVPRDTEASRAFLKANPLILESDEGLYGVVFTETRGDQLSDAQFTQVDGEFFCDGLSHICIVSLDSSEPPARVPPEWASRISVRNASEILGFC